MATGGIRIVLDGGDKLAPKFITRVKKFGEQQRRAVAVTARRLATEIETAGRQSIASGGDFKSARWQQGFKAVVSFESTGNAKIRVTHSVSYWRVFEFGAVIQGKPLLWIPLDFSEAGQLKVRARDFPGKLFRVDRKNGAPLLMNEAGPQYFGKESVRIPRKWRLRDTVKRIAKNTGAYYKEAMANG